MKKEYNTPKNILIDVDKEHLSGKPPKKIKYCKRTKGEHDWTEWKDVFPDMRIGSYTITIFDRRCKLCGKREVKTVELNNF